MADNNCQKKLQAEVCEVTGEGQHWDNCGDMEDADENAFTWINFSILWKLGKCGN